MDEAGFVKVTPYLSVPDYAVPMFMSGCATLTREAIELQPIEKQQFTKRAAAIHEASHCVVAAVEGRKPRKIAIWRDPRLGAWLGEYAFFGKGFEVDVLKDPEPIMREIRILLAGRRGEMILNEDEFCLVAGLDELVWCQLMIMPTMHGLGLDLPDYHDLWCTTQNEVDETLRRYQDVVMAIAQRLMVTGRQNYFQLTTLLSPVEARKTPPPIRRGVELTPPFDPLA